jgi:hypothetical protein
MKLKLDLHPIFSDSRKIEQGLNDIILEAVSKRASEVEIIPGKGSGALKKTVLRFLERPEIKPLYHRVEKDDENFGRIFVHFRFHPDQAGQGGAAPKSTVSVSCFCCQADIIHILNEELMAGEITSANAECRSCGSPNKIVIRSQRSGKLAATAESGYEADR